MMNEPWSKKHKRVFKLCRYSLSNSFAQPLSQPELTRLTLERGDRELVREYHEHGLGYTPNGGSADLRREIAALYESDDVTADNVLVFPGGQVALLTAALAFAGNCHSIVFAPGYQSTVECPSWAPNSETTRIERRASSNWRVDLEELRRTTRENTRFIVLNEPHNPSGVVMDRKTQREIVAVAEANDAIVLCDEVYRLLEHDPAKDRIPAIADAYDRGISAVTMSKPWGACGVTIGWLVCRNRDVVRRLSDIQYFGTACPSRASEIQAIMVLRASDVILEERRRILLRNRRALETFVTTRYSEFFEWVPPNAGAIAFVRFKGPLTSEELGERLAEKSISVKPAYCFTDRVVPENDYFRVGFGETKMLEALEALASFVEENKDDWRRAMAATEQI